MNSNMDYDKSEPKHVPIIVSIVLTILVIVVMTFGIVYYFKGSLTMQVNKNEQIYGKSFELQELNNWEANYLNSENENKININDAINLTISNYNK